MSATIDMIVRELELFNQLIKNDLDGKSISNTNTAKNSLRTERGEDFARSIGIFYLEFLDTGRGGGKFPPTDVMKLWVRQKLGVTNATEINQVAFLVGRKISLLGTEIQKNPSKGIELSKKIVALRQNIREQLGIVAKADVIQVLDKFKKIRKLKLEI